MMRENYEVSKKSGGGITEGGERELINVLGIDELNENLERGLGTLISGTTKCCAGGTIGTIN